MIELKRKNNTAVMVILQSIADFHLEYIKDIEYACQIIKKLERIFPVSKFGVRL